MTSDTDTSTTTTRARHAVGSVVHVITSLGTGGAERQLQWLAHRSNYRSTTIALYDAGPVADAMRADGSDVEILGMGGILARLTTPFRLARRIRRLAPDVVHVHLLSAQLWGIPAARLAGVRLVVSSEHSLMDTSLENRPLDWRLRRVYRLLERMSRHTVAVSDATMRRLRRWGVRADRITVIDNGIDFDSVAVDDAGRRALRDELGLPASATLVGAVGRLEEVKRFPQLLRALAETLGPERHLAVAGRGPLHDALLAEAERLGVAPSVHLLGARTDMRAVYSAFDVLVSPSRDETFGMAVVEALGNGLPVAVAQCPAIDELDEPLPQVFRLLATDPDAEAAAIREAVAAALATGRSDRPAALERRYGIDATVRRIDGLYDDLRSAARR
jgi:glycosyltransferase involved in cell wall biosynthesis